MSSRSANPQAAQRSSPRAYHSPKREQSSRETHRRIRDAAEALFLRDGYVRTTTKAIANQAGVSEMTVFTAFSTKAALLSEVIRVAVRGDERDTPMAEREVWHEMLAAPPDQILARFAQLHGEILQRTAVILALAESAAAADPELAVRRDSAHAHIRADFQQVADTLATHHHLAAGVTARRAADAIYALANHTNYLLLTDECGWPTSRYIQWLTTTLTATLTPPESRPEQRAHRARTAHS